MNCFCYIRQVIKRIKYPVRLVRASIRISSLMGPTINGWEAKCWEKHSQNSFLLLKIPFLFLFSKSGGEMSSKQFQTEPRKLLIEFFSFSPEKKLFVCFENRSKTRQLKKEHLFRADSCRWRTTTSRTPLQFLLIRTFRLLSLCNWNSFHYFWAN